LRDNRQLAVAAFSQEWVAFHQRSAELSWA
jgi:hypothetical protein